MTTHPQAEAVSSLLHKFQNNNFNIVGVSDGEEFEKIEEGSKLSKRKQAVEVVCSVDQSIVHLFDENGENCALFIVLGNDDHEIVADFSSPRHIFPVVDEIVDAFVEQWEK
jgi:adenosine/AMP kinase